VKFIPNAIVRKIASQQLLAHEHSPRILFVGGVVGMLGSTVLACRATLKLESVLDEIERDLEQAKRVHELVNSDQYNGEQQYSDNDYRRDKTVIVMRGVGSVVKLYAPAMILGGASVFALTKSHSILNQRNIALTAAYAAVDGAFKRYRSRVVERFGDEVDRELRFDSEEVDIIDEDTGKITTVQRATDSPGSIYARFFDEYSSRNWSPDPDINLLFLRTQQNWLNDRLRIRGHVFLNEVYDTLGLAMTKPGAIVGWRWNKDSGDNYIDFGIWDGTKEVVNDFFNGREGAILLDFNVDGVIFDKMPSEAEHTDRIGRSRYRDGV